MIIHPKCVAYYPLTGDAKDYSGHGLHSTSSEGTVTYAPGKMGLAPFIAAGANGLKWSTTPKFTTGNFTVSFWINLVGYTNEMSAVLSRGTSGDVAGLFAFYHEKSDQPNYKRMFFNAYSTTWIAGYPGTFSTSSDIPLGVWTHYALAKTGTAYQWYVNGTADTSAVMAGNITDATNTKQMQIGTNDFGGWPGGWNGGVQHICIFTAACPASDIKRLMLGLHPISI